MANREKWSNRQASVADGARSIHLLPTKVGLRCRWQRAGFPLSHVHWCMLGWRPSPRLISLVPVRSTEMAPWQLWEWMIALLASRTHHTRDNN